MHLIRPYFLLLIVPAIWLVWMFGRNHHKNNQWKNVCDLHLLKHLTITNPSQRRKWPLFVFALSLLLAIFALTGPSWKKIDMPVFNSRSPLIILLDLSYDMTARDIKPSRLARAKYKIIDLLKARKGGQTALLAFTKEPFVVAPLTEDVKTIVNLMQVLKPNIMPVQGHDLDSALKKSGAMIQQSGGRNGHVLIVTNQAGSKKSLAQARKLYDEGISVSVLGVGSKAGAPAVDGKGKLIRKSDGNLYMSKIDTAGLKKLAKAGGGVYQTITSDNKDVSNLLSETTSHQDAYKSKLLAQLWQDEGHWFILLLLPFAALAFRRGYL